MRRRVRGIVSTAILSCYLSAIFFAIGTEIEQPRMAGWDHIGSYLLYLLTKLSLGSIFVGTVGLIAFGIPLLAATSIAAWILHGLRLRSPASALMAGALVGLSFGAFLAATEIQDAWIFIPSCFLSGTICGWVYWCIALNSSNHQTTELT